MFIEAVMKVFIDGDQPMHGTGSHSPCQIEDLIHRYPEHYHWSYKRFKAHPNFARTIINLTFNEALTRLEQLRMRTTEFKSTS